jgi:hypothetical protein
MAMDRRRFVVGALALPLAALAAPRAASAGSGGTRAIPGLVEPDSTFFGTVELPYAAQVQTGSDGDLWPSAWADDDALYAANGDGRGFSDQPSADLVANRLTGTPGDQLAGTRLAASDAICPVWSDPARYNRKPTGMLAIDGNGDGVDELYLAVQDLRYGDGAFDDAAAASVAVSTDHGVTWTPTTAPMFTDHVFTTVFFLDFGKSSEHRRVLGEPDSGYAYAYGLDGNWRTSYVHSVPDPVDLYLARVPIGSITDRSSWQFCTGVDANGRPGWSGDIGARSAVLHDERRLYPTISQNPKNGPTNLSVLAQGSVVYHPALERYLYTSWTEYTFEFYEAPAPWGPWKLFLHKDFGPYPWWGSAPGPKNGGYATTIPSRYAAADGTSMWVQSNWFVGADNGPTNYDFSLRELRLTPWRDTTPGNPRDAGVNLARTAPGTVPIDRTAHYGRLGVLNDGDPTGSEDSWNGTAADTDQWGYTWPQAYSLNRVVYTTGAVFADGGWFGADLRVQVRQRHAWVDVTGASVDPAYPYSADAGANVAYTFRFDDTWGDGVRIVGTPGGAEHFTSIAELAVYFD